LVEKVILEQGADPSLFAVVSNPEFLREGSAIHDTRYPDRIVIGAKNRNAAAKLVELYAPLESKMFVTDLNSAELIKYSSNSFLAMKISFINAVSRLCEACGANVEDVAKGVGSDSRIGPQFLGAGLGYGGSCFPKDVLGLLTTAARNGYDFKLLKEVIAINDDQTLHAVSRLESALGGFSGKTIGLMGLAFKPNTDDIRDAKSLVVIEQVLSKGGRIRAFDPIASPHVQKLWPQVEYVEFVYDVSDGADALMLVTEWNEFRQLDLPRLGSCMKRKLLFDGRRAYKRQLVEKAGFEYMTVGS
jgi:UDPglucose 6-dehydrogenase